MPFIGGLPEDVIHPMSPGFSKIYQLLTLVEGGASAAITQYADLEAERGSVSAWEGKLVALFLNSHELMLAALALRSEIEAFARSKAPSFERSVQVASDSFDSVSFFKDFRIIANAPEVGCDPVEFSNGIRFTSVGAVSSPDVPVGIPFHDSSSADSGQAPAKDVGKPGVGGATGSDERAVIGQIHRSAATLASLTEKTVAISDLTPLVPLVLEQVEKLSNLSFDIANVRCDSAKALCDLQQCLGQVALVSGCGFHRSLCSRTCGANCMCSCTCHDSSFTDSVQVLVTPEVDLSVKDTSDIGTVSSFAGAGVGGGRAAREGHTGQSAPSSVECSCALCMRDPQG